MQTQSIYNSSRIEMCKNNMYTTSSIERYTQTIVHLALKCIPKIYRVHLELKYMHKIYTVHLVLKYIHKLCEKYNI